MGFRESDLRPQLRDLICHRTGACHLEDGFQEVVRKVLDAEGIILSSPNFKESVSGQRMAFMDKHYDIIHCLRR